MKFNLDTLMDKIAAEIRTTLPEDEVIALITDTLTPRWLVLQALLNAEINGKLNALAQEDVSKEGAMLRMAKHQGNIEGLRRFWLILEELAVNVEQKENERS